MNNLCFTLGDNYYETKNQQTNADNKAYEA